MSDMLTMSKKELTRFEIIQRIQRRELRQEKAAELLNCIFFLKTCIDSCSNRALILIQIAQLKTDPSLREIYKDLRRPFRGDLRFNRCEFVYW